MNIAAIHHMENNTAYTRGISQTSGSILTGVFVYEGETMDMTLG
jgi:phage gp37-like protein